MMFENILVSDLEEELLSNVRESTGSWVVNDAVKKLRSRLLVLQNYYCAYCQFTLFSDEVGFRELDHILPKSPTKDCSEEKGRSNSVHDRQHTFGYPQFIFEPLNLIVTCKICNSYKKSYDPLLDRSVAYEGAEYPGHADIMWFYPYAHYYSHHISRSENLIYTQVTPQGGAVIEACKLDKADALAQRIQVRALVTALQAESLRGALTDLAGHVVKGQTNRESAVHALVTALSLDRAIASKLLELWIKMREGSVFAVIEQAESLLAAVSANVGGDLETAADLILAD